MTHKTKKKRRRKLLSRSSISSSTPFDKRELFIIPFGESVFCLFPERNRLCRVVTNIVLNIKTASLRREGSREREAHEARRRRAKFAQLSSPPRRSVGEKWRRKKQRVFFETHRGATIIIVEVVIPPLAFWSREKRKIRS